METFDPDTVMAQRREALLTSLRRIDADEARRFVDEIFAGRQAHPWFQPCHDFLDTHPRDAFLRGEVGEGYTVIYDPSAHAGLWCKFGDTLEAVGLLHGRGLEAMKEAATRFLGTTQ